MNVQGRLSSGERVSVFLAAAACVLLLFPQPAHAVQVGCFCTFIFVSSMFVLSIGMTLLFKRALASRLWKLPMKRISLITFLEVLLLVIVLFFVQARFEVRILAFLPFAFLLNYALTTAPDPALPARQAAKKRALMAALSALVLPLTVQVMGFLAAFLSSLITFTEVRV